MESIFKGFLGMFFLLILSFTGVGLIEASIDARKADSFLSEAVELIEAGHYRDAVIDACASDAKSRGYELDIDIVENERGECFGTAKLSYSYRVPLLGLSQEHMAVADIR